MKDLIMVGIQGSGKGTQSRILAGKFGYKIFETGSALRAIAAEDSELGHKVKEITERGDLVPNEIVIEIVQDFLQSTPKETPIIFDGIPRSAEQLESLDKVTKENGRQYQVLELRLSEEEVYNRLMKRAELEGRADDNPESIKKRVQNFHDHTAPLLQVWQNRGILMTIDGEQPLDTVTQSIITTLNHE